MRAFVPAGRGVRSLALRRETGRSLARTAFNPQRCAICADLIAKGYGLLISAFIILLILPVSTIVIWRI
ncbi:MAG: hypothetical protein ACREV5_13160 [Steroidobacter sp.]